MATMIDIDDLVDSGAFAEILGIKRRTVLNYLDRERAAGWPKDGEVGSFPRPLRVVGVSPVWTRAAAEQYALTRPGPGWHQKGDERVAKYIRDNTVAGADEDPLPGVGVDSEALQPEGVAGDPAGG